MIKLEVFMSLDLNFHLEEGKPPLCIISSKDEFMAVIPHYSNHCYTTLQAVELIFVVNTGFVFVSLSTLETAAIVLMSFIITQNPSCRGLRLLSKESKRRINHFTLLSWLQAGIADDINF